MDSRAAVMIRRCVKTGRRYNTGSTRSRWSEIRLTLKGRNRRARLAPPPDTASVVARTPRWPYLLSPLRRIRQSCASTSAFAGYVDRIARMKLDLVADQDLDRGTYGDRSSTCLPLSPTCSSYSRGRQQRRRAGRHARCRARCRYRTPAAPEFPACAPRPLAVTDVVGHRALAVDAVD